MKEGELGKVVREVPKGYRSRNWWSTRAASAGLESAGLIQVGQAAGLVSTGRRYFE